MVAPPRSHRHDLTTPRPPQLREGRGTPAGGATFADSLCPAREATLEVAAGWEAWAMDTVSRQFPAFQGLPSPWLPGWKHSGLFNLI